MQECIMHAYNEDRDVYKVHHLGRPRCFVLD